MTQQVAPHEEFDIPIESIGIGIIVDKGPRSHQQQPASGNEQKEHVLRYINIEEHREFIKEMFEMAQKL